MGEGWGRGVGGGLGVRSIVNLSPSAFLASTYLVKPLVAKLLTPIQLPLLALRVHSSLPKHSGLLWVI